MNLPNTEENVMALAQLTQPAPSSWGGEERRSIPIHVLDHVDRRLNAHTDRVVDLFKTHTDDEMERYQEILRTIAAHRDESDRRHFELAKAITAHMEQTALHIRMLTRAFPEGENGEPDLNGHAEDHKFRIQEAKDAAEFRRYVKKVVTGVAIAVLGPASLWLLKVIWVAFLAGPAA